MAKTTRQNPNNPIPISSSTAVEDPPADTGAAETTQSETSQPAEAPAEPKPPTKTPTFTQTMNKVPKADWGARANIYLYRVEPVIDRTRTGDPKFINCYAEPVNEERVMADYGSGRYKLILNFRKPGADTGDIIDSIYMDILNMQYPPKIPLGEWTDDPKNKRWAWAKQALSPAAAPAAAPPSIDPLAAFGTFMDIQDRIEDRVKPAAAPVQAATVDPWAAAEKILNMRSDNPMVEILKTQMESQAKAMEAERARQFTADQAARQREHELQQKLMDANKATAAPAQKDFLSQLIDFGGEALKTKLVSSLFGGAAAAATEAPARAGRMNALEFISDFGPKALQTFAPLIDAAAHKIINATNGQPAANGNGQAIQTQQVRSADPFGKFITDVVNPKMVMYFNADPTKEGGESFADVIYALFPEHFERLQNFEHPALAGLKGADAIVMGYRNTPHIWQQIGPSREVQFVEFVKGFCGWNPIGENDEDVEDAVVVAGPVDFDAQETEESIQ